MSDSGNPNTATPLSAQIQGNTLGRTLSGVIRSELATIEAALQHGLRYEHLCEHLGALGIQVSPGTLRQTVYRLRHERRRIGVSGPLLNAAPGPSSGSPPVRTSAVVVPSVAPTPQSTGLLPSEVTPSRSAFTDAVPLLEVKPSQPAIARGHADFISEIRQSCPDLEVLAYRYRQSLQRERVSAATAVNSSPAVATASADVTSTPSSTGSPSS